MQTEREIRDSNRMLDKLIGSTVDQADFDGEGNLFLYFGDEVISINYSCYGGVYIHRETDD